MLLLPSEGFNGADGGEEITHEFHRLKGGVKCRFWIESPRQ
jgi:hypothetical protein